MSPSTWRSVSVWARAVGRVALAGFGEPFTDPRCIELLKELDAAGVAIAIATNGTRITRAIAGDLASLDHLIEVNVSIDSPDPVVYRRLRHGPLARAMAGLALLAEILPPERLVVSSVLFLDTAVTLLDFTEILRELGVRRLSVSASHDYNQYSRASVIGTNVSGEMAELEARCRTSGIALEFSNPVRTRAELGADTATIRRFRPTGPWDRRVTRQCLVPWEAPFVDQTGTAFACCYAAASNERPLGQLHGEESFDKIWNGVAFGRFRADLVRGETTPDVCRRCTTVPLGRHPYADWSARLVQLAQSDGQVVLTYRNTGDRAWTASDNVRIGSSEPRDCKSPLASRSWLSPNRAATFAEEEVPPGADGTFRFDVMPGSEGTVALVADGTCWLPGTDTRIAAATVTPTLLDKISRRLIASLWYPNRLSRVSADTGDVLLPGGASARAR